MSISFSVQPDFEAIKEAQSLFEFVGGNSKDALRIAVDKSLGPIRTLSSKTIREQVNLSAGYVNKDRLTPIRPSKSKPTGSIKAKSAGMLLSRYSTDAQVRSEKISWLKPPPEPARGIRVKVKTGGGTEAVDGKDISGKPFYMVLKGGRLAIAGRRNAAGPKGGKIKVFHGPSVSQVFKTVRDDVRPQAGQELQKQLLEAMNYLLKKRYPVE